MPTGPWRRKRAAIFSGSAVALILMGAIHWRSIELPSFAAVQRQYRPSDAWILDRHGRPLGSIRTRGDQRSLDWVSWSEVSPAFRELLVRAEDRRFHAHPGVDPLALLQAVRESLLGQRPRGASTLTMQLVGMLQQRPGGQRGLGEKISQLVTALKLDANWDKAQILEAYVNLVPFRGELVGLRAAAQGHFAKSPASLDHAEAALLVALLRAPNATPARVSARACHLLQVSDCQQVRAMADTSFGYPYQIPRARDVVPVLAPEFQTATEHDGVVRTTLDASMQALALETLREQLRTLRSQNVHDGAVLVLETATGKVVAYVANGGAGLTTANQIDGIQTRRQAGSTLKPFVYATAFDERLLTPHSLLEDSPTNITVAAGRVYHPRNYDHVFRGVVGVGDALGSSMNVPAVRTLQLIGEGAILRRLHQLGFTNLEAEGFYGPSLALGTVDVTLWELTHAYRRLQTPDSPFSARTRADVFAILAAPEHRRHSFGMNGPLTLPFPAAVKTGTSKDMRDNWCVGLTPHFTVGVWVGNFDGAPMWNVSGLSGAAPVWRRLMTALHANQAPTAMPAHTATTALLPRRTISRITYPAADMLLGLDPDIPARLQQLPIEIDNPRPGHRLYLNGALLGKASETHLWALRPGRFKLELRADGGEVMDLVRYEVR
jgi:penicillin-binding protein 1C